MVKLFIFGWVMRVVFRTNPNSKPLRVIFNIIFLSVILFFFFSQKGGRTMGFLWILVYLGGMLIVFLYLLFLIGGGEASEGGEKFFPQVVFSLIFLFTFTKFFFLQNLSKMSIRDASLEYQEFYRVILTISCSPIFILFLSVISGRLFLYLGVLKKKIFQSKISFLFLFIIK